MANGYLLSGLREGEAHLTPGAYDEQPGENGGEAAPGWQNETQDSQTRDREDKEKQNGIKKTKKKGKRTKPTLGLGSLNIAGRGNLTGNQNNKWNAVNHMMKEEKLGVLCVQETHCNEETINTLHTLYGRRMKIFHSSAERATIEQGVAIILNRELVDIANVKVTNIIPGRAIMIKMHWHLDRTLSILNVYAPNNMTENTAFWKKLDELRRENKYTKPDILAGDFNVVEEAIDRIPIKEDNNAAVQALADYIRALGMKDGWRNTEPTGRDYTFPQRGSEKRSRLDRIYTTEQILSQSHGWTIQTTGIPTDHRLPIARLSAAALGRWQMPAQLLTDKTFLQKATEAGVKMMKKLEEEEKSRGKERTLREKEPNQPQPEKENIQLLHADFKKDIQRIARNRMKEKIPKLKANIKRLQENLDQIKAEKDYETNPKKQHEAEIIQQRLFELEKKRYKDTKQATATHYELNAERVTKYWSAINKERKPRDVIYTLRTPHTEPAQYVTKSKDMANLAKEYHNELQREGDAEAQSDPEREECIQEALNAIPTQPDARDLMGLGSEITKRDIKAAIKKTEAGKATGIDGIPYEFWEKMITRHIYKKSQGKDSYDCLEALYLLYRDIDENGIHPNSHFTDGWMCPIYKKKDRREIENYRPITLLNTDYKIYTRILTTCLGMAAPELIHRNQAGFVPNRHIEDQTQTCRVLVDYAETMEINGVIITLDQEKAYDKIDHQYLWRVLKQFGIPNTSGKTLLRA